MFELNIEKKNSDNIYESIERRINYMLFFTGSIYFVHKRKATMDRMKTAIAIVVVVPALGSFRLLLCLELELMVLDLELLLLLLTTGLGHSCLLTGS